LKFDYGPFVFITSMLILTASLTDTGLPQQLIAHVLGEDCGNNGFSEASDDWCTLKFGAIIGLSSSLLSSMPTALILTATFPYASPYAWMQMSFITSMCASLSWSYGSVNGIVASKQTKDNYNYCWKQQLIFTLPSMLYSICIGSWILGQSHVASQCIKRLGECEEVYSLGG
jgi:Na+/H+ antiporter NhaD/arsenite permease-like protein